MLYFACKMRSYPAQLGRGELQLLFMKKILTLAGFRLIAFAAALLVLPGCNKQQGPSAQKTLPVERSADTNSFQQVASHLEAGGDLYLYLSTQQLLEGLSTRIGGFQQVIGAIPNLEAEQREKVEKVFQIITNLVKASGIESVSGFGVSSIAREANFYHTKAMLHHYPGKGAGFLWTMFGQKPHALDTLDMLPATTAMAVSGDLDVRMLWSVIKAQVAQAGLPQADEVLGKLPQMFEGATGLNWDQVLDSLGGEYGFVVTLDESKKISIPLPNGETLEVPDPGLMLILKVKNDTIFNRIDAALKQTGQQILATDKPDMKMRTLALPLPLPIQLRPTVATGQGYLFVASTDSLIEQVLGVKAGQKPGLKATEEFRRVAKDVQTQGNSFSFVSQRFGQTVLKLQRQAMQMNPAFSGAQTEWLQSMLGAERAGFTYSVSANTDEGWLVTGNGNQHPAKLFLASAVVPVAIVSAVAIPAFVKARQAAERKAHEQQQ